MTHFVAGIAIIPPTRREDIIQNSCHLLGGGIIPGTIGGIIPGSKIGVIPGIKPGGPANISGGPPSTLNRFVSGPSSVLAEPIDE